MYKNIFRENGLEFIERISKHGIPLIIFSAGFGDVVKFLFENKMDNIPGNLYIVSNMMIFDAQVRVILIFLTL